MQPNNRIPARTPYAPRPPIRPGRLIKHPHAFLHQGPTHERDSGYDLERDELDIAAEPTLKLSSTPDLHLDHLSYEELDEQLVSDLATRRLSTVDLMQVSGMIQAVRVPREQPGASREAEANPEELWAARTRQLTGSFRAVKAYESGIFEKTQLLGKDQLAQVAAVQPQAAMPAWKAFLGKPAVKLIFGGLVGLFMLYMVSRFVDLPTAIYQLRKNLATPQGAVNALLATLCFTTAFSIRASRWRLFLRPITKISIFKAIRIYWIGVFVNVLLPVQGGELTKSLMLKRVTGTPVSRSLPTVAMDKSLDLMPALVIMAVVPFIPGIHMNPILWGVLALVGGVLIGVIFVVGLTAWNRAIAIKFIQLMIRLLPRKIGEKIEGFAMGFVDSLLASARRPKTFIPALLLTCAAVTCDGLFAMFSFWAVGLTQVNFGMAIFGYTFFNMFMILPTPPGQVGWNEFVGGTLIFGNLLGFDHNSAVNMFLFSHPLTALIMATMCMISLSSLGLKLSSALKAHPSDEKSEKAAQIEAQPYEREMAMV